VKLGPLHKVRVFESMVLRRIFGHKVQKAAEGRRKLNNYELHNLYTLLNIIRMTKTSRSRI